MNGQVIELMESRYSMRSFSEKKVEEEKVALILKAGQLAPTACNKQPIRIYVLKSEEALETLQKCKPQHFGETLAFLICYDENECWVREYDGKLSGETDAAIVTTHMMLEAWNLEVGSTWIMKFIPEAVKEEFELPENIIPASILVMGYPGEAAAPSPRHAVRKPVSEFVIEK